MGNVVGNIVDRYCALVAKVCKQHEDGIITQDERDHALVVLLADLHNGNI